MENEIKYFNTTDHLGNRCLTQNNWAHVGINYTLTQINNGTKIHNYEMVMLPGVKIRITEEPNRMIEAVLSPEEMDRLNVLHKAPLVRFDFEELYSITLEILNKRPGLRGATLMGWAEFPDMSKDPNYYSGVFIFADGNEYTIVKKNDTIQVYPCGGDYTLMMNNSKLPLITFKISTHLWSKRIEGDNESIITILNR